MIVWPRYMYFFVFSISLLLIFIVFIFSVNSLHVIYVLCVLMFRPILLLFSLMSSSMLWSSLAECEKKIRSSAYRKWKRYSPSILIPLSPHSILLITSLFKAVLNSIALPYASSKPKAFTVYFGSDNRFCITVEMFYKVYYIFTKFAHC